MILADLRYAFRSLRSQPLWTTAALVCLAIGTGANTASLSVINAILLRPLPFADPGELAIVDLLEANPPRARIFSWDEYREVAPRATLFRGLAARTFLSVSISAGDPARMVQAEAVSGNYFDVLRLTPLVGRFPESRADARMEAMFSERLWRGRFGSDPTLIGRTIRVNGRDVVVTGIAPPDFTGATQLIAADMWLPAEFIGGGSRPQFQTIGRLQPGATREQARQQLDAVLAGLAQAGGGASLTAAVWEASGFGFPLAGRGTSAILFALIGLVVGVAVANVAGLMLARAPGRRREIGVRLALGAGPARIMRMILVESLVLGFAGSAIGAAMAAVLTYTLPGLSVQLPEHLRYTLNIHTDGRVLIYAAFTAVVVSIVFGLAPARQAARTNLIDVLKQTGTSRVTAGSSRALSGLVIGQMAVSTMLLVVAALLARTYIDVQNAEPGIDTSNILAVTVDLDQAGYEPNAGLRFYQRLLERVASLPDVTAAGLTSEIPLAPSANTGSVPAELADGQSFSAESKIVTPGFFELFRIPLLQGRDFEADDPGSAIVNETMAAKFWPGRPPLGQTFRVRGTLLRVIGVVKDIKYRSLIETPRAAFYRSVQGAYSPGMAIVVRSGNPSALVNPIREVLKQENADLAVVTARTMDEILEGAVAPRRQSAELLALLCGLALVLSAAGLYGVVAFGVRERAREFGLRMALGARPGAVASMILRRGLRLAVAGLLIGLAGSFGLAPLLARVLIGVRSPEPATMGIVGCILLLVALAASYLPARWATRIDPAVALRAD